MIEEADVRRFIQARAGGAVIRCHGVQHLRTHNNAQHQWGAALLLYSLFPVLVFDRLVAYVLFHDVPEFLTGDIPAPALDLIPGLKEKLGVVEARISESLGLPTEHRVDDDDYQIIKTCDRLDLWLWCKDQLAMGNRFAQDLLTTLEKRMAEPFALPHVGREFMRHYRLLEAQGQELPCQRDALETIMGGIGDGSEPEAGGR